MKKLGLMITAFLFAVSLVSYAQMTDEQVIAYTKSATAAGKGQSQIAAELLSKGVTKDQVERIKAQYESSSSTDEASSNTGTTVKRNSGAVQRSSADKNKTSKTSKNSQSSKKSQTSKKSQNGRKASSNGKNYNLDDEDYLEYDDDGEYYDEDMDTEEEEDDESSEIKIFGHDIFSGRDLTFEPNENIATPSDYVLGPGDEVLIEIWGYNEATISQTISPEGRINISQTGPIYLSGLTIKEASNKIKKALVSKYASIAGDTPNSSVSVSLGQIRTIQVNVMGEASIPGTYRLSPFATVFNALYNAGGVTDSGSLRAIKVIRNGKEIAKVDVYGYLFEGKSDSDIRLKEGDIIIVPPYVNLVSVEGSVKRPMYYELKDNEKLETLIEYAGGFSSNAYKDEITVVRNKDGEKAVSTVKSDAFGSFAMADGDIVTVGETLDRFSNMVIVQGDVFRPGIFELGGSIATVKQLVAAAGGVKEDAFLGRAVITREKADLSHETISVNIGGVLNGSSSDVLLQKNDVLLINSKYEVEDAGTLTINGYVNEPGEFEYAANTTVEDLILMAGGLMDGASYARVDVARRVNDPKSLTPGETLGESFSFAIKDGLAIDGGENFTLQPYDVVSVRRSPGFKPQQYISVTGEVAFPGDYVIVNEGERVSDLVKRAGGATNQAYLKGATLYRRATEAELRLNDAVSRVTNAASKRDSLDIDKVESTYTVAVQLEKAIENPGSDYDVVLRENDQLVIPEYISTVKVSGSVMYPNTVVYLPNKSVSYYVNAAGGFSTRAKRNKAFIIYLNGNVAKAGVGAKIEPGCEVIVPAKPEKNKMSAGEIISMGTSAASLTTMIATLVNLLK